jgi:hypothetical protein
MGVVGFLSNGKRSDLAYLDRYRSLPNRATTSAPKLRQLFGLLPNLRWGVARSHRLVHILCRKSLKAWWMNRLPHFWCGHNSGVAYEGTVRPQQRRCARRHIPNRALHQHKSPDEEIHPFMLELQ